MTEDRKKTTWWSVITAIATVLPILAILWVAVGKPAAQSVARQEVQATVAREHSWSEAEHADIRADVNRIESDITRDLDDIKDTLKRIDDRLYQIATERRE